MNNIKTQVVIYTAHIWNIGGIESFVYYFCMQMKNAYDIVVVYDDMDIKQMQRLVKHVRVVKNGTANIECDTLIINSIFDKKPTSIKCKKFIRMVHSCKQLSSWNVPTDCDLVIPVSEEVKKSFGIKDNCKVIGNLTFPNKKPDKVLRLVSATRMTAEKGEKRMIKLANMLNQNNIPFVWTVFTKRPLDEMPNGMVFMKPTLDISSYIADSDYLVQLSDTEAFCYSIVEALELGTPVITTPLPVLNEIGFVDGENGFTVPFDMENVDINKIYESKLSFQYKTKNTENKRKWKTVLGNSKPKHDYSYNETDVLTVRVVKEYNDLQLGELVYPGNTFKVTRDRAVELVFSNVCMVVNEEYVR